MMVLMAALIVTFGFYWCLVKIMSRRFPFHIAALVYISIATILNTAVAYGLSGGVIHISWTNVITQYIVAMVIFYFLDLQEDSENIFTYWFIFLAGFVVLTVMP